MSKVDTMFVAQRLKDWLSKITPFQSVPSTKIFPEAVIGDAWIPLGVSRTISYPCPERSFNTIPLLTPFTVV